MSCPYEGCQALKILANTVKQLYRAIWSTAATAQGTLSVKQVHALLTEVLIVLLIACNLPRGAPCTTFI